MLENWNYKNIGIYGASGFGKEVLPLLRSHLGISNSNVNLYFIDDNFSGSKLSGIEVIDFNCFVTKDNAAVVIAIADSKIRELITKKVEAVGIEILSISASSHIQMDDVHIGCGSLICDNTMITSNVHIGKSFHMNIYSYIAHDCVVGDYVTFGPRVMCNGNVHIGEHAYIGTGAMIKQGTPAKPLIIGEGAIVGMGSVVTKSVPAYSVVFGNPAVVIKKIPTPSQSS